MSAKLRNRFKPPADMNMSVVSSNEIQWGQIKGGLQNIMKNEEVQFLGENIFVNQC